MNESSPARQESIHPTTIVMFLMLASVSFLFIGLIGAYLYNRVQMDYSIPYPPIAFYVTIVLLFVATRFMRRARNTMQHNSMRGVVKQLAICLGLTVIFAIVQVLGWVDFFRGDMAIQNNNALGYLFALSALHHAHVVAGLPFLGIFLYRLRKTDLEELQTSQSNKRYLVNLSRYWNFVDVLWIILVAMLLVSALLP